MKIDRNILINNPDKELLLEKFYLNKKEYQLIDFWNKINQNIIIKENKQIWPDYIFFCKDKYITQDNPNGILMYYNEKNEYFVIDYEKIWSIFKSKFKLNTQSINKFVMGMVFKTYNLKVVTTLRSYKYEYGLVFKTYNLKVVTTVSDSRLVESRCLRSTN